MKFFEKVYVIVKQIPAGQVTTYGRIAKILGLKNARVIGWALHANKDLKIPCHRVVNRAGRLAKNYAFRGEREQKRRLEREGVGVVGKRVDLKKYLYRNF